MSNYLYNIFIDEIVLETVKETIILFGIVWLVARSQ